MAQLITVSVTTDASGDYSKVLQPRPGRLLQVRYVPDDSTPLDTGADIDLVGTTSGFIYINQDNIGTSAYSISPRVATHGVDGTASLYAAGGEPVEDFAYLGGESLTFTVANGGNVLSGTFFLWFG